MLGTVNGPDLFQALRGVWKFEGQKVVLEVDQETGELLGLTGEGEGIDPRAIVTKGVLIKRLTGRRRRALRKVRSA